MLSVVNYALGNMLDKRLLVLYISRVIRFPCIKKHLI